MSRNILIFLLIVIVSCQFIQGSTYSNNALQSVGENLKMSQKIRRHLNTKYAQQLTELLDETNQFKEKLDNFAGCIIASYEKMLVENIFSTAIDEMVNYQTPQSLAAALSHIYQPGRQDTFEVMIHAQLHLFRKFKERQDVNDVYIFNVAYYMSQITRDELFQHVPNEKKLRIEAMIDALPIALQNFFFEPSFCLQNKAYQEYIYTPVDYYAIGEVVGIFSWKDATNVEAPGKWLAVLKKFHNSNEKQLNLTVALKSLVFDRYVYMEPRVGEFTNLIASWRWYSVPARSDWSVQLVNDHLVFEQNGIFMCNSMNFYNTYRRYVQGFNVGENTRFNAACQWRPCQCE